MVDQPYLSYDRRTGEANFHEATSIEFLGTGYSGKGIWRNKPQFSHLKGLGPLPAGWYTLEGPHDHYINSEGHNLGNIVFRLIPDAATRMFDRAGMCIHGNNKTNDASEGCIILGPSIRQHIAALYRAGVRRLLVC